jgi:hypothetical protein
VNSDASDILWSRWLRQIHRFASAININRITPIFFIGLSLPGEGEITHFHRIETSHARAQRLSPVECDDAVMHAGINFGTANFEDRIMSTLAMGSSTRLMMIFALGLCLAVVGGLHAVALPSCVRFLPGPVNVSVDDSGMLFSRAESFNSPSIR